MMLSKADLFLIISADPLICRNCFRRKLVSKRVTVSLAEPIICPTSSRVREQDVIAARHETAQY